MPKPADPNARSSSLGDGDLDAARTLSRKLAASPSSPAAPPHGYTRLPGALPAGASSYRTLGIGAAGWDELLLDCRAVTGASGAFVIDTAGLVVATHGSIGPEDALTIGSHLVISLEHADRMRPQTCRSVQLEFADAWLTGLRLRPSGEPLTVGLVTPSPMSVSARSSVEGILSALS